MPKTTLKKLFFILISAFELSEIKTSVELSTINISALYCSPLPLAVYCSSIASSDSGQCTRPVYFC